MNVCDTKRLFDTEFEASIAVAHVEAQFGGEYTQYQCGTHWHIAHANSADRRGAGKHYWRCPVCKHITPRQAASKHKCGNIPS